jgi:DNA-binding FrmR family transcriptional regulator
MVMCADKQEVLSRFDVIEERLNVIGKMIDEGQPCLDVLRQMYAVRKGLSRNSQLSSLTINFLPVCVRVSTAIIARCSLP